jgi:acyl-CoA synthetase (AMP-forming)/AMP-acid ligase II
MHDLIVNALQGPVFGPDQRNRDTRLDPVIRALTGHHLASCEDYARIVDAMFPSWAATDGLAGVPFVPVGLFKRRALKSVPDSEIFKTVTSSGTTGVPSRVYLDRDTASRQTRALTSIMSHVLGTSRRPMLIVDTDAILTERTSRTARAAGVAGLMALGRNHTFLLDERMTPQPDRLATFAAAYGDRPILIFGFTFMVWKYLYETFADKSIDLSNATVVHSGGWKQMEAERVGNDEFKRLLADAFGVRHVVNFYGMAEQVGAVFIEGTDGRLHTSCYSDIIVRDPETWREQPTGTPGVLQVISCVPTSYPGHSILTEDLGVVDAIDHDPDNLGGKAFRVLGRLPRTELRGCSDTFAVNHG